MRISMALVIAAAAACADSTQTTSVDQPLEGCPAPGAGTTIGGLPGTGADATPSPVRRLVLMGGGPEEDGAARRFVEAAAGGDIVVLRATGSLTSYPDYFSVELAPGPAPASVVTIRTDTPPLADHPSVLCRLDRAEAIWFAGGSQWDYLGRWPHPVHVAIREAARPWVAPARARFRWAKPHSMPGTVRSPRMRLSRAPRTPRSASGRPTCRSPSFAT
ncbi:MAG: hypothetical protein OXE73_03250 [Gammaproteobacteria bacterium]|nr:hypothetical protein [Gammaproteobacteria bacterium]